MKDQAGAEPVDGVRPLRPLAKADGVVITVRVSEPQHDPARNLGADRVDEFLADETHGRRAQDHDALFVQPDDAQIGSEIQHLSNLELLVRNRVRLWSLHIGLRLHSSGKRPTRFRCCQ